NNDEYKIKIEEYSEGNCIETKVFNIVLDSNFNFNINQTSDCEYLVDILLLNKQYSKSLDLKIDNINEMSFDGNVSFILPLAIPLFKVDSNEWHKMDHYVWMKDLSVYSNLRTNGFYYTKASIKDSKGKELTVLTPSEEEFYLDLPVGVLRSYDSHDYVVIDFYEDDRKIGFLYCYFQCVVNQNLTKFWYDQRDKKFNACVSYYGKGNVYAMVYDENDQLIFQEKVESDEKFVISDLQSFENYNLTILDKKIGFTLESDRVIYESKIKYYSMDDFVGRYFQIYTVDFDQNIRGEQQRKKTKLYNTYFEISKRVDDYIFEGNVYIYKGEKRYLDKINSVEIEFTSDINDGEIEAFITFEGDGLFIDFDNHTILNCAYSDTATDIFSYHILIEWRR
ncbi:MAG: hypothetical protein K2G03_00940, partial [Bacilli bacterium]|nr:hypothetical protein [Bacilli bacterium]